MPGPDVWDIVKLVAAPAFGIVGGWIAAARKATARVEILEKEVSTLTKKQQDDHNSLKSAEKEARIALGDALRGAFKAEHDALEEKLDELKKEFKELDDSFDKYTRTSVHDFANNEQFHRFTEEWQRQCQHIQRTLGQIEGLIKADTLLTTRNPRG